MMSDFSYHLDGTAARIIDEPIARNQYAGQHAGLHGQRRRHHRRHSLAAGLHSLADRLDS